MTNGHKSPAAVIHYAVAPERMPPIAPGNMSDAQKSVAADISAGRRGGVGRSFHAMLRSPGLTDRAQRLGEYLRYETALDPRIRELATLLAARNWTQQYEWHVHVPHALKAGLKPALIEAIAQGRRPGAMAQDEEIAYDMVMELLANKGVSDPTYERAVHQFCESGVVDLLGVLGYYSMLAMIMNVARTGIPDGQPLPLVPLPEQLCLTPLGGRSGAD